MATKKSSSLRTSQSNSSLKFQTKRKCSLSMDVLSSRLESSTSSSSCRRPEASRVSLQNVNDGSVGNTGCTTTPDNAVSQMVHQYESFGLRTDEAQRHAREVGSVAAHRTSIEWLDRRLRWKWSVVGLEYDSAVYRPVNLASALFALGFTEASASEYAAHIMDSGLPHHRTVDEWIHKLLLNFECMLGTGDASCATSSSDGDSPNAVIEITVRGDGKCASSELLRQISERDAYKQRCVGSTNGQLMLLFHGTQAVHARSIRENGIDIDKGQPKQNFSHGGGFYISGNAKFAVDFARAESQGNAVSVLVYACTLEELRDGCESGEFLDLYDTTHADVTIGRASYGTGSETARKKQWEDVILHYSSGEQDKDMKKGLKRFEFIRGPWAADKKYKPRPLGWQDCALYSDNAIQNASLGDNNEQICIKSDNLAAFLDTKLLAVATVQR